MPGLRKKLLKSWTLASLPSLLTKLSNPLIMISAVSSALRSNQKLSEVPTFRRSGNFHVKNNWRDIF
uniref:Uncharacterized protein n=1 Tax=Amphimedon queenslandica TaxID=400682 RepID=A0A1X7VGR2_AMPQE